MFKLDDNEEIIIKNWPVIINVPQDGGGVMKCEVFADYLLLPQDQYDEQLAASREGDGNVDADILRRVVRRLEGFADADGKAIDFTPELLERVIRKSYIRAALMATYFEVCAGKKAKRKN
ncbi:MAG TPA: hypothetical protein VFQ99_00950 [Gallionella sp.]|nr:hypothetical protein [Gallionella sp.]